MRSSPRSRSWSIRSSATSPSWSAATPRARRRGDGELRRAQVRDPLGDELRRGAAALPARRLPPPSRSLYAVLAPCGPPSRGRAHRRAHRHGRGLPRPRRGGRDFRECPRPRGGGADGGEGRDEPLLLARRRNLQGRRQGGERPAQAGRDHHRAARAARRRSSRRSTSASCPGSGRAPRSACRPRDRDHRRLAALADADLARLLPGKVGRLLRDRARGSTRGRSSSSRETISIGHEETFERDVSDRARLHDELRRMATASPAPRARRPGGAHGDHEGALPGLLHPQPLDDRSRSAPRTRSGSATSPARSSTARSPIRPARCPRRRQRLEPRGAPAAGARTIPDEPLRRCRSSDADRPFSSSEDRAERQRGRWVTDLPIPEPSARVEDARPSR